MRARDVVGKRIKRVVQKRRTTEYGVVYYDVAGFDFDDGSRARFVVNEMPSDYGIEGMYLKAEGGNDE